MSHQDRPDLHFEEPGGLRSERWWLVGPQGTAEHCEGEAESGRLVEQTEGGESHRVRLSRLWWAEAMKD